ncbi:MAG TPA: HAMP domain-containing protein, partial [Candidatus Nitrosotalea sp.]|nr:HAMP domain-containing protein [Candidatus Nitrosotalea sp.]
MDTVIRTDQGLDTSVLLEFLAAYAEGDFSARLPAGLAGGDGRVAEALNRVIGMNQRLSQQLERLAQQVGREGRVGQRVQAGAWTGSWARSVDACNQLVEDLVAPSVEIARVIEAVARGDLSQSVPLDPGGTALRGEFGRTARSVNTMVHRLSDFSSEVTRVAREVGTEGRLGGQADVRDVSGTWKDLTDNVNLMAANLTEQVRGIARVVTAVAQGDLEQRLVVEVKGEVAELAETINRMTRTLATFAEQVTGVAREVG